MIIKNVLSDNPNEYLLDITKAFNNESRIEVFPPLSRVLSDANPFALSDLLQELYEKEVEISIIKSDESNFGSLNLQTWDDSKKLGSVKIKGFMRRSGFNDKLERFDSSFSSKEIMEGDHCYLLLESEFDIIDDYTELHLVVTKKGQEKGISDINNLVMLCDQRKRHYQDEEMLNSIGRSLSNFIFKAESYKTLKNRISAKLDDKGVLDLVVVEETNQDLSEGYSNVSAMSDDEFIRELVESCFFKDLKSNVSNISWCMKDGVMKIYGVNAKQDGELHDYESDYVNDTFNNVIGWPVRQKNIYKIDFWEYQLLLKKMELMIDTFDKLAELNKTSLQALLGCLSDQIVVFSKGQMKTVIDLPKDVSFDTEIPTYYARKSY